MQQSCIFRYIVITIIIFTTWQVSKVDAWDNEEFEMFDLVEEVGKNFYEVIGVPEDASSKDIRQAYRKLSVKIHPDKSDAPDAEVKFRQLVGIYEVLKNENLRKSYNQVLVDGLPNWRNPVFYYRRVRKMALWQVAVIVLSIVSVGQYLAGWASYFEKKLSVQEAIQTKVRKTQRTRKAQKEGLSIDELAAEVEKYLKKPSLLDIAPIQLCRFGKYLVCDFPGDVKTYFDETRKQREEEERLKLLEEERLEEERQRLEDARKIRKEKRKQVKKLPERNPGDEYESAQPTWDALKDDSNKVQPIKLISGGLWTDDDIAELTRLCSKFPGGTPDRWEKISELLCRPVSEVTFMAKKTLEKLTKRQAEEDPVPQTKSKVKTKGGKGGVEGVVSENDPVVNWTTEQQQALETALQCFPKGCVERWERIAQMVPGRTKEECMQRFKYLADLVKKKKEKETPAKDSDDKENVSEETETPVVEAEEENQSLTSQNETKVVEEIQQPEEKQEVEEEEEAEEDDEEDEEEEEEMLSSRKMKRKQKKLAAIVRKDSNSSGASSQTNSDGDWCVINSPNSS